MRDIRLALLRFGLCGLFCASLFLVGCSPSVPVAPRDGDKPTARDDWPARKAASRSGAADARHGQDVPPSRFAEAEEADHGGQRRPAAIPVVTNPWWVDRVGGPAGSADALAALTLPRPSGYAAPAPRQAPASPAPVPSLAHNRFDDFHEVEPYLHGVASWYGPTFHGKPTANGEIYDQYGLTAAHPVLPMGTRILVENLENERRVYLRVNDRGPYKKGRILDLSYQAAQQLDVLQKGTAPVRITVLQWPEQMDSELGLRAYRQFVVQLASNPDPAKARAIRDRLQAQVGETELSLDQPPGSNITIIAGPYDNRRQASWVARRLQQVGVTSLVRSYRK